MPAGRRVVRLLNRPAWSWALVALLAGYALLRGVAAVREPSTSRVVTSLVAALIAVLVHAIFLAPARPPAPRIVEDRVSVRSTQLVLHGRWHLLVLALLLAGVALLLTIARDTGQVLWTFAAIFVALSVPGRVVGVVRRPRLRASARELSLRGAAVRSTLAWEDVEQVGRDTGDRGLALVVTPRAGAVSWQASRARVGRFLQGRAADHRMELEMYADRDLDIHDAVGPWLQHYLEHPADRVELGTAAAADRLDRLRSSAR